MDKYKSVLLALLRVALGWILLYSGFTKLSSDSWSAAGFLKSAGTFPGFYEWLASPSLLPITNFLNEWGQLLLGIALILGVVMTLSSLLAALMMVLYYFVGLNFPMVGEHSYLVDEHIIYALGFLMLAALHAGNYYGLGKWWSSLSLWQRYPKLKKLLV